MGQEVMNMEAFKGVGPAKAFQSLDPTSENLADGIGSSYGVLNYRGKVWSIRHRGEKKNFVRPDDGTPSGYLDCIILQQAPVKSKSYFKKFDPNGSSEGERPICSSLDGVTPDADVMTKQAEACAICPRNVWKTDENGRKGRECQDYKRLAVLLLPTVSKAMFGEALMEPVFLRVPPASLNNLALLGEQMAGQGYHFSTYVTRINFDPAESHPKMVFKAVAPLSDREAPIVLKLRNDPICERIIGMNEAPVLTATTVDKAAAPQPKPEPQPTPAPAPAPQPQPDPAPVVVVPAEQVSPTTLKLNPEPPALVTGFDVPDAPPAQPAQAAQTQTSDTGEPDEADDALDAKIASLMPKSA